MKSIVSMDKFDIESLQENIHFKETKLYFQEVMMTYQIGAYRSSVVTLWSVVVCDIVLRLQHLIDLYNDSNAIEIIDKIQSQQNKDRKSSSWELKILEEVLKQTQLINQADFENLIYLQKQRHLCAHPTLSDEMKLYKPNKETVRALIRNTLESVLSKPPFYTDKIINIILEDLSETSATLTTLPQIKQYIESRYLNRLTLKTKFKLYRMLWKFTFLLEDNDCKKNRKVNYQILMVLFERNLSEILELISNDIDYYSKISNTLQIKKWLVLYLSKNNKIFNLLSNDTKSKIKITCQKDKYCKIFGWFTHDNLNDYYAMLSNRIQKNQEFPIQKAY